jgi:plasmid stability protein
MKTTLDLPEDLVREIKLTAAREGRKLKDVMADLLRAGLAAEEERAASKTRRCLPIVNGRHAAIAGNEMTPQRVANILLEQEASWHAQTSR